MNSKLEQLLKENESTKLDFKRQWYWNTATPPDEMEALWGECIKDILSLANGNPHTINETAYLVIGIEDKSKNICAFDFPKNKQNKILSESQLQQMLLSKLNTYSQPEFTLLNVEYLEVKKHKIILISIPPRAKLLSLSKDLILKKRTDKKGTTYYRVGEEIRIVSGDIYDEYSKAPYNNLQDIGKIIDPIGRK